MKFDLIVFLFFLGCQEWEKEPLVVVWVRTEMYICSCPLLFLLHFVRFLTLLLLKIWFRRFQSSLKFYPQSKFPVRTSYAIVWWVYELNKDRLESLFAQYRLFFFWITKKFVILFYENTDMAHTFLKNATNFCIWYPWHLKVESWLFMNLRVWKY